MQNFFLHLYVKARTAMVAKPESGFVTAEHLAIAVVGILLVGGIYTLIQGSITNELPKMLDKMWNR